MCSFLSVSVFSGEEILLFFLSLREYDKEIIKETMDGREYK